MFQAKMGLEAGRARLMFPVLAGGTAATTPAQTRTTPVNPVAAHGRPPPAAARGWRAMTAPNGMTRGPSAGSSRWR